MMDGKQCVNRRSFLPYPEFWLWVTGETISAVGTNISLIAIPWLVLSITHSSIQTSLTTALEFIPYLLFSVVAGIAADTFDRRILLIWTNILRALVLIILPVLSMMHELRIVDIYILSFLNATLSVWFKAAQSSVLPRVLPASQIHLGNSVMQWGNSVATMLGPSLGGAMIAIMPVPWVLSFDASSYVIAGACVMCIRTPLQDNGEKRRSAVHSPLDGLQFVLRDRMLRSSSSIMAISNFANYASFSILIFYSRDVLHYSAQWSALILGSFGVGFFVGALVSSKVSGRLRSGSVLFVSRLLSVVPATLFAIVVSPYGLAIASAVNGFWMVLWSVQTTSFRQVYIPDFIRGRVSSVTTMIAWIMIPLGSLTGGFMAQSKGCTSVFAMAVGLQLVNILLMWNSPLRKLGIRASLPADNTRSHFGIR